MCSFDSHYLLGVGEGIDQVGDRLRVQQVVQHPAALRPNSRVAIVQSSAGSAYAEVSHIEQTLIGPEGPIPVPELGNQHGCVFRRQRHSPHSRRPFDNRVTATSKVAHRPFAVYVTVPRDSPPLQRSKWVGLDRETLCGAFEGGDAVCDRWVGVEEPVDASFVMLQWVVDTHRRGRVVEFF